MSGIYIKAETPKTCCLCKLMIYNPELVWDDNGRETTGAWVCLLTGELIDSTKREKHCPITPAADVASVVRSCWIELDKGFYVCGNCRNFFTQHKEWSYCPNCGAKMDGGKKNEHTD